MTYRTLLLFAGLLSARLALAADPCAILGLAGYTFQPANGQCEGYGLRTYTAKELELRLAAQAIAENRALLSEIQGLRSQLQAHAATLNQAKAKFEAATAKAESDQQNWRKEALEKTLSDITAIPAQLGSDKGLREALLATLKEELPKDAAFVQALLQASKK